MLSKELIKEVRGIFQESTTEIDQLNIEKYDKKEKKLLYLLLKINEVYLSFSYRENPYKYLMNIEEQVEKDDIKYLVELIYEKKFKVKIYDFLWICFKDYDSSQNAYNSYIELIKDNSTSCEETFYYLVRAFSLAVSTGKKNDKINEVEELVGIFINKNLSDETAMSINLLEMFFDEKVDNNDFLIEIVNKKLKLLENKLNVHIMEAYLNLLEKLYASKKKVNLNKVTNDKDIIKVRRLKVDYYLKQAKKLNENAFVIVDNYKKVIKILKTIPNTEKERILILKDMEQYQNRILNFMQEFKYEKDMSKEVYKILEPIKGKNLYFSIGYFALSMPLVKEEYLTKRVLKNAKQFVFSSLFPGAVVDKRGKIKYKLPSILNNPNDDDISINAQNEFMKDVNFYAQVYVSPILNNIIKNFNINEDAIKKIVDTSAFVPEKRKVSFTKGLLAGFQYDFITSLSILLPQIENAVRDLAELCGDVVYNNNEEGIEELKTLNAILDLPYLNESLESDLIFNMKSIFTSKYGLNMRNDIAHGILDDSEFNTTYVIYTWWFILKLCCMNSSLFLFKDS